MTYREAYEWGRKELESAQVQDADVDARLLLEYVCHTERNDLLVHGDREVEEISFFCYQKYIEKRSERIPLQQLLHEQEFMGLSFYVNEHVLIPRQDTEILVEEVLREPFDGARILDMCTGSGCILLSLLSYSNDTTGVGVDLSPEALAVAGENAERLQMLDRVQWVESDLFANVKGKYDILVSNPPYIRSNVIPELEPEVRAHEPMLALDGGRDGLDFYKKIIEQAGNYLIPGGRLYFEIGYDQGEAVAQLLKKHGYHEVRVVRDYAGLNRVVCGVCPRPVLEEKDV